MGVINEFAIDLEADGFVFESTNILSLCLIDLRASKRINISLLLNLAQNWPI